MNNPDGIFLAETIEERSTVYKLRYDVYVEELGRYKQLADHDSKLLIEDVDQNSRLFYAVHQGNAVAGMRQTWGGDAPFSQTHIDQYQLTPFLEGRDPAKIIIGERLHVHPDYRGTDVLLRLFAKILEFVKQRDIELIFGDCEPHLLKLYESLGFRTYSKGTFNNPEAGDLILLVLSPKDTGYLKAIDSPLLRYLESYGA